jgi:hypothetical protein
VGELAAHADQGLRAAELLRALKPSIVELDVRDAGDTRTLAGRVQPHDAPLAARLAPLVTPRPAPDLGEYARCLGHILGPDIRLCPEFGLNVHGKGLYFVPFDFGDLQFITGRNVHDRLVAFAAERHADWAARQAGPAPVLTLTTDGAPVALSGDGRFTVATTRRPVQLLVIADSGESTALQVP